MIKFQFTSSGATYVSALNLKNRLLALLLCLPATAPKHDKARRELSQAVQHEKNERASSLNTSAKTAEAGKESPVNQRRRKQ
jgi:hypothetical protein